MATRQKQLDKLALPVAKNNLKPPTQYTINEAKTTVATNEIHANHAKQRDIQTIEISSDSSQYDDSEEDVEDDDIQTKPKEGVSGPSIPPEITDDRDLEMVDAARGNTASLDAQDAAKAIVLPQKDDGDDSDNAPTFGDLVRANDPVDVPTTLLGQGTRTNSDGTLATDGRQPLATPSISSLGTVLSQALRTDDNELLESCLRVSEIGAVHNTVQRLDTILAAALITKLASRLHRRPGRAGTLMVWVQWTLICHGGSLARDPDVKRRLTDLQRVLKERAEGLPSLLMLKGKLDLLESQVKNRRLAARRLKMGNEQDPSEEEENIVYVEDEADDGSTHAGDDGMPLVNGIWSDVSEDEDEDDDDEEEEEESGAEEVYDDDDVDHEEEDSEEDDDSDMAEAAAPPPTKIQKTGGTFPKRK